MSYISDLIGFINAKNGTSFAEADLSFGAVAAKVFTDGQGRNSEIAVSGVAGRGFIGSKTVSYTRLDFATLFPALTVYGPKLNGSSSDLIDDLLLAKPTLGITAADIVVEAVDYNAGGTYLLKAKPGNLKFVGEVLVTISLDTQDVYTLITNGNLDGFSYPA